MKNITINILILLLIIFSNGKSQTKNNPNMITIEKIQELYDNIHKSGGNTDIDMLYGYFFTNSEPETLKQVATELKQKGFNLVDISPDEEGTYWLHIERIEKHNAKSLFELNKSLYKIADKYKITSYDGFDIGNVNKSEAIGDTYIVPDNFVTNNFVENDIPYLVIANKAFDEFPHKNEFNYFIIITTTYINDNWSKLPNEKEMEILNEFEMFIENNLNQNEIKNYYIGRTTHNSKRIIYFVTNKKEGAKELLKYVNEKGKQREFTYTILKDENWSTYKKIMSKIKRE